MLERDGYTCQRCGRPGFEVDHIRPIWKGGPTLDTANLQVLDRGCHIAKTRRERQRPIGPKVAAWKRLVADI